MLPHVKVLFMTNKLLMYIRRMVTEPSRILTLTHSRMLMTLLKKRGRMPGLAQACPRDVMHT